MIQCPTAARPRFYLSILFMLGPGPAVGQAHLFPRVEAFEYPVGSLRPSGTVGRVIDARRGESAFGAEREADVSIGENIAVLGFGSTATPMFAGLTIRATGRFSLDDPKSTLISNDWIVGIHGVMDRGPWRIAAEIFHESSHLGDEYRDRFLVERVDWTREVLTMAVRRRLGVFDGHLGVGYTLIDALGLDPLSLGFGLDFRGHLGSLAGAELRPVAGVYAQAEQYAGWKVTTTARTAVEADAGGRRVGLGLVFLNGLSTQRQFFRQKSRYMGFELRFDW